MGAKATESCGGGVQDVRHRPVGGSGAVGDVKMHFTKDLARFENWEPEYNYSSATYESKIGTTNFGGPDDNSIPPAGSVPPADQIVPSANINIPPADPAPF